MPKFKCTNCTDVLIERRRVAIKIVSGKAVQDIQCPKCGAYLELAEPKSGCAGFTSNSIGQL